MEIQEYTLSTAQSSLAKLLAEREHLRAALKGVTARIAAERAVVKEMGGFTLQEAQRQAKQNSVQHVTQPAFASATPAAVAPSPYHTDTMTPATPPEPDYGLEDDTLSYNPDDVIIYGDEADHHGMPDDKYLVHADGTSSYPVTRAALVMQRGDKL